MKYLLLLLFTIIIPISLHAEIDERKIDVYFANGIDTLSESAKDNALLIEENIALKYGGYTDVFNKQIGEVYTAYNQTNGIVLDLWESLAQKLNFQSLIDAIFDTDHEDDIDEQVTAYKNSIKDGHRVLTVAHSQGNLFTAEALDKLDGWMQDYFYAVSVASPKAFKIKSDTPHIAFDNDVVAWLGGVYIPLDNPNDEAGSIESHAFTYYMGLPAKNSGLTTDVAKNQIMDAVNNGISNLNMLLSQWQIQNENTETTVCEDRRTELVHFKNAVSSIPVAFPFNENGKVYQVPDTNGSASYVIGSADGIQILDIQNDADNRCYELENTPDVISIENTCRDLNTTDGVITVDLLWTKKELDLDLIIKGPTEGEYLNKDKGCPREYFYIKNESGVETGTYKIKIGVKGNVDESMVPESVGAVIKANGKTDTLIIPVEDTSAFDMGYVAEIQVSEDKKTTTTVSKTTSSGTQIISGTSTSTNTVYPDYIYEIIRLISQIYYGPVRDAHLEFYSISNYAKGLLPLFVGATSGGYDLHTAGLVFIPFSVVDQLNDNELYLLSAQGGEDIDADDDGKLDAITTPNYGTLHGTLSGKMIKDGAYKVNILTELAYQVTKDMFDVNTSEVILERMDKVAQRLISIDVNGDKIINSKDLTKWLPTTDKDKLLFDYNTTIESIVQKLFNGEDIFMDAYKLLYYPVADAGEHKTVGTTPPFILDGSKSYDINGNIVEYLWMEGDTILCQSSKPVCEIDMLDIGTHNINLKVTDNDGETRDDNTTITVTLYAPVAKAGADQEIFENGTTFTLDGSNSYDSNGEITEYTWSSEETVYCQGVNPICIIENLSVSDYSFTLKVTDDENNTATDTMNVIYPYKPVAIAGDDINTTYGKTITLDGSNSYDSDGYIVEYKWSEGDITYCSGDTPACTINNLDAGDHVLKLQVTDDKDTVGVDRVNVNVYREMIPKLIGVYSSGGTFDQVYYTTLSIDRNIAYVAEGHGGLKVLDVSDSTTPKLIKSYDPGFVNNITLSRNETIACITNSDKGVDILDISDPFKVTFLGRYSTGNSFTRHYANNVSLSSDGNTLYVSYNTYYNANEFRILDISNPETPILLSKFSIESSYGEVILSKNEQMLYIPDGKSGLRIFDVSNSTAPILLGSYNTPDWAASVTLSADENIAYIADSRSGIQILDVSDPTKPIYIGSYNTPDIAKSIVLSPDENIAYVADGASGLQILDISNPAIPTLLASYGINPYAENITLSSDGNIAYISAQDGGLQIVDVSSFSQ